MNAYIQSLRVRTLPLSVSGIILGTGLAGWLQWDVFGLAIGTTLSLQIVSNLANELGDALKGTDSNQQGREAYGLQSGRITQQEIITMSSLFCLQSAIFLGLGLLALIGAVTYTLGKHSYGYMGLGDLGVFLFFGLLSSLGAFYLQTQAMTAEVINCGVAIGMPCVGVLNLNNIRDMLNDRAHGKHTFASILGPTGARIYHTTLLMACLVIFSAWGHLWTLCIVPVWGWHLWYIWSHTQKLDRQMPILMFSTLLVTILALI